MIVFVHVEADDLRAAQTSGVTEQQDRAISQPAHIEGQGGDHGEDVFGQDRLFLDRWACMLALDAGQHRRDVPALSVERKPALRIVPGQSG